MYLVDTNVLSEARRGNHEARVWLRSVDASGIYLSVITLGEIMKGIALKLRADARTAATITAWLEQLRRDYIDRILPISDRIALEWGRLAAERPRGMAEGLIEATALVHAKIIVTRNVEDFSDSRVPVISPWNP
jgi:predicted nucleic acid-binding protein